MDRFQYSIARNRLTIFKFTQARVLIGTPVVAVNFIKMQRIIPYGAFS